MQQPILKADDSKVRAIALGAGAAVGRALVQQALQHTFAALAYRNFRLYFIGQSFAIMGRWTQIAAQGFLVYELTHSATYLGLVGFAAGLPTLLLMWYGGVITDRIPRPKLLLFTQTAMMLLAFSLAVLTFTGLVTAWQILILAFLQGVTIAFDTPARFALIAETVGPEELANATSLNGSIFQLAAVVGPAVGGIVYALFGPAWCFAITGVAFSIIIIALLKMNVAWEAPLARPTSAWHEMTKALRYVSGQRVIMTCIALYAVASLFGLGYMTLLPKWTFEIVRGDATTNGWLQSANGVGALTAALMMASLGRFKFKGKLLTTGSFAFPLALLLFSQTSSLPTSLGALLLVGSGWMILSNMTNLTIQLCVSDEFRGRAMSMYLMVYYGFSPLGALIAGTSADRFGVSPTVAAGAMSTLVVALVAWFKVPQVRAVE